MTTQPAPLSALEFAKRLKRAPAEHKGHAGKVVLVGGAPGMAGALLLAGNACLHLGAGWTILEMLDPASALASTEHPELMIRLASLTPSETLKQYQPDVIAIGPGLGKSEQAFDWLQSVIGYSDIPIILDADALNLLSESKELLSALQKRNALFPGQSVITPHPGEAAQLLGINTETVQENRLGALEKLIALTQSIVVLKGRHTLIAAPHNSVLQCQEGNPGMGTGGMGDVLTGSIAAIAAQGTRHQLNLWQSTCIAVQLHATAADSLVKKEIGPIGLTPSETILEMRSLLNKLL